MKKYITIAIGLILGGELCGLGAAEKSRRELIAEIEATPEKSGGIYYAYPVSRDSMAPLPRGFEPYYVTHYGRHGSRWMINETTYSKVSRELKSQGEKDNLTPLGERLTGLVRKCGDHAEGHFGELTPLGERQHAAIARRMARRYPTLFADSSIIVMRSSTVPRCIISMAAFSESLKDYNPELKVERHASPGDMDFIHYKSPGQKEYASSKSEWMRAFSPVRDSLTMSMSSAQKIFKNPGEVGRLAEFMRYLHDIAVDIQDVDGLPEECGEIYTLFTPEDLYNQWLASNYMMFMRHADPTPGRDFGPACAESLLTTFMESDRKARPGQTASLHFGHDTSLVPLLSLMGVEGCGKPGLDSPEEVGAEWQTFRVTPMGGNLQMAFFRNAAGKEIVSLRLNESPARVGGVEEFAPGYYEKDKLYDFWRSRIRSRIK